jgi:RNA polymerase sigma factor (sigma-70 family)
MERLRRILPITTNPERRLPFFCYISLIYGGKMTTGTTIHHTTEHLFRHEAGKLVAVLTRVFGPHNLQLAEDVVQDSLVQALETWKRQGLPENPTGWLLRVAKNKALDLLRRQRTATAHAPLLQSEYTLVTTLNEWVQEAHIPDDQLRMMFVCCHPSLGPEAQVALILKTLGGFSVAEVARAFITQPDTIEKRLYRARQQFKDKQVVFAMPPPSQLAQQLDAVLAAIYAIFNEGYSATRHDELVRTDLMEEAMRLAHLLAQHPLTGLPKVKALLALFCFQAARHPARLDEAGNLLLLKDQDRGRWHRPLIEQGIRLLEQSATGEEPSRYHLEAMIAYEHAVAPSFAQTHWGNIIAYYDVLYRLHPSPIVALNRAIAIGEKEGPCAGIAAVAQIPPDAKLQQYYLLPATLGEWHARLGQQDKAAEQLTAAMALTQSAVERRLLEKKLNELKSLTDDC